MALRTHNTIEETKKMGADRMQAAMQEMEKQQASSAFGNKTTAGDGGGRLRPQPPLRGIPGFFSALGKEIRKDLGL